MTNVDNLKSLGSGSTSYPTSYDPSLLEYFEYSDFYDEMINIECSEFTSLCPKTAQPDFAKITINYIPNERLVESKSLKLYLFSFRNHGAFHEDCVQTICTDLRKLLDPQYIEVIGNFNMRGGISINPRACSHNECYREFAFNRMLQYKLKGSGEQVL